MRIAHNYLELDTETYRHVVNGEPYTGISFGEDDGESFELTWLDGDSIAERWWHQNGVLKSDSQREGGAYHGVTRAWHPNGELMTYAFFFTALCKWVAYFDENGGLLGEFSCPRHSWRDRQKNLNEA